jgi:hypothetical protein
MDPIEPECARDCAPHLLAASNDHSLLSSGVYHDCLDSDRAIQKLVKPYGVEPVFLKKEHTIDYALQRVCLRLGWVLILDSNGNVDGVILFDDANRKL